MRLRELTWPEDKDLRDPRKLTKQSSVIINNTFLQFFLPGHKADKFFEGNTIIVCPNPFPCNPMALFKSYLAGGATSLAENGVAPHIIQGIGRWGSDTWHIYI
ncbi:hypothetical protein L208DRAFT_1402297 [Tricholoma matsutake]|nr:hypothetical protein L208DRAFT_1402297 [Tricholoma matsutake 945]